MDDITNSRAYTKLVYNGVCLVHTCIIYTQCHSIHIWIRKVHDRCLGFVTLLLFLLLFFLKNKKTTLSEEKRSIFDSVNIGFKTTWNPFVSSVTQDQINNNFFSRTFTIKKIVMRTALFSEAGSNNVRPNPNNRLLHF